MTTTTRGQTGNQCRHTHGAYSTINRPDPAQLRARLQFDAMQAIAASDISTLRTIARAMTTG